MKAVPIVTFNEIGPAQVLRDRLQMAGIPATIHDESKVERFWFMSEPLASVHIVVPPADYLSARHQVEDWDKADGALRDAVRCPACNASRIEYPQITRKFVTPILLRPFMALGLMPKEYYCQDCAYTWSPEKKVEPELDVLGWPYDSKMWHPERAHK